MATRFDGAGRLHYDAAAAGRHSRPRGFTLGDADIQEIKRVVAAYQKEPLRKINAVARNKVRVEVGSDKRLSRFPLLKRDGRWLVDETGEFESESTIITI